LFAGPADTFQDEHDSVPEGPMTLALQIHSSASNSTFATHRGATAADPHGLTRMLMDGALERLEAARERDPDGAPAQAGGPLEVATVLIGELRAGLDLQSGGAISANIDDLYDYMCRRLDATDPRNGLAALHEVSHLLDALRSAWAFMPAEVRAGSRN
jgi:flagellar protein FliS